MRVGVQIMGLRPKPQPHMQWLRLLATCLVINMALTSVWLIIQFDGTFAQGPPSPSELHVTLEIDLENTTGDIKLQRATNFIVWTRERDEIKPPVSEGNNESGQSSGEAAALKDEEHEPQEYLDAAREIVVWLTAVVVICEFFLLAGLPKFALIRNITYAILLTFLLVIPLSYIADLNAEGGGYSYQGNQPKQDQYAHYSQSTDTHLVPLGFIVEMETSGYDLGWVDPEYRDNVSQTPPKIGEEGYDSFISFKGTLQIALGKTLQWVLILPLIWFMLPTQRLESVSPSGRNST